MTNNRKNYVVVDSDFALNDPAGSDFFLEVISKSIPTEQWIRAYSNDIPTDGRCYIVGADALPAFYKKMTSIDFIKIKDSLKDFILIEDRAVLIFPFKYEIEALRESKEVKRSAFNFLTKVVAFHLDALKELEQKVVVELSSEIIPPQPEKEVVVQPGNNVSIQPSVEDYEEFFFFVDEIVDKLIKAIPTKNVDRSLDSFEGIKIYSDANPLHYLHLSNSSKKGIDNKILISELFIIIKAAKMLNSNSIKFNVRQKESST
jgi:hypothetical protein